ncbi:ABC transporter, inner membrane subunit [gamma proteobacterium HTCC5015]|nr:ABC transporter, inner membrane subunit [gamma proteobacterium HTCC5015]
MLVALYGVQVYRYAHWRQPWGRVFKRHTAAIAAVVLGMYALIGLSDSVHWSVENEQGQQSEALSLLDYAMTPMRTQVEKSYSAPFSIYGLSREMRIDEQGQTERALPRLDHAGSHLPTAQQRSQDIRRKTLVGLAMGAAIAFLSLSLLALLLARGCPVGTWRRLKAWLLQHTPARSAAVTYVLCLTILTTAYYLGQYYHVWGTDKVGYDVFYIAMKSVRTGLVIGTLTTVVMLPLALALGMMAGYFRGWVDDVVQYIYTTLNAIPGVLLIAAAVLMLNVYMHNHAESFQSLAARADWRLLFICLILGMTSWTSLCRLLRAETLKLRESDYVVAAKTFGVSTPMILFRHLMPNVMHIVLITVVIDFSGLVLAEAVLAYVEIGVDPTMHSWGNMINSARLELARDPIVWWSLTASLIAMFVLVLCANLFADAVRDAFDPRLKDEQGGQNTSGSESSPQSLEAQS